MNGLLATVSQTVLKWIQVADLGSRLLAATLPVTLLPWSVSQYRQQGKDLRLARAALRDFAESPVEDPVRTLAVFRATAGERPLITWTPTEAVAASGSNQDLAAGYRDVENTLGDSRRESDGAPLARRLAAGRPSSSFRGSRGGSPRDWQNKTVGKRPQGEPPLPAPRPIASAADRPSGPGSVTSSAGGPTSSGTVVAADSLSTSRNTPVVFSASADLLANDTSDSPITLTSMDASSVATPPGTVVQTGPDQFRYTPGANFSGTDSFSYSITGESDQATGTVHVTVSPKTPPSVAQVETGTATSSASVTTSGNLAAASSQIYVAFVVNADDAVTVTSVTGLGLSWTPIDRQCSVQNHHNLEAWYAQGNPVAGPVTATFSGLTFNSQIAAVRVSGASAPGASSRHNRNGLLGACGPGPASNSPIADLTTSGADTRILSAISFSLASNSCTATTGTQIAELGSGSNPDATHLAVQSLNAVLPAVVPISPSLSSAARWATISVELLPE